MNQSMKKVLLLLLKGVELSEAGAFLDVLGWSGSYGDIKVEVTTASMEPTIISTFGLTIKPKLLIKDVNVEDYDALAIPGGFGDYGFYDHAFSSGVSELIQRFNNAEKLIASICVGALSIANSGVLRGRRATTYHLMGGRRRKQLADFNVEVVDERIVEDGNIITSTSPQTAMDTAFLLLEKLTGIENTIGVKSLMGF